MEIDIFFENLKQENLGTLDIKKSKWFNGHAYLPITLYTFILKANEVPIEIIYEYRQSEFSKSSAASGGTFSDRHLCRILLKSINTNLFDFSVSKRSFWDKMINRSNGSSYVVKCKHLELKKMLQNNENLNSIYRVVNESSSFEPSIIAKLDKGVLNLEIAYNTDRFNSNIIIDFISFLRTIISLELKPS